ncbi:MAG: amino acid permease, partial [Microbacteriaceae bacterium]
LYYLVTNIAAFTQPAADRRYPKFMQLFGTLACIALVITLPLQSVLLGLAMFAVGIVLRVVRLGVRHHHA